MIWATNHGNQTGVCSMWMMINANGYTLDENHSRFDALVVEGQRVLAVGSGQQLRLQYGAKVGKIIDVAGATVVPGLVDSHLHIAGVGEQSVQLNLTAVRSKSALLHAIRTWGQNLPDGAWIVGGGWDDNRLEGGELPSLAELDEASAGHPLCLSRICHHAYLVNSKAFHLAGVGHGTPDPADGSYGRDGRGELNGRVYENAIRPLFAAVPPLTRSQWRDAIRTSMKAALAAGITAVHTDDVRNLQGFAPVWETYYHLIHEEGVHLRVHELVDWHHLDECIRAMRELPAPSEWLEMGVAKLFSDGALGGRTAWFADAYSDAPNWHGTPMYTQEELDYRVWVAHEKGFGVGIHAIGDAALEATLSAMEKAPRVNMRDRVIHAEVVSPDLIRRMVALGSSLAVDIQPRFTVSDFPWIEQRIGAERLRYACAWKTLREAGLHLAGGSDAPIEPLEPLLGIHAAVTRRQPFAMGEGYQLHEALSPLEAVQLFSRDACFANQSEAHKGVIAPGWLADLTVLSEDIVNPAHPDQIRDAKVSHTIVGGKIAYAADGSDVEWSA
jgi:predicted amidohydrolase YtcJ